MARSETGLRIEAGRGSGVVAGSPVDRLVDALRGEGLAAEYTEWSSTRFGRLVVSALRHLALHGPTHYASIDSVPVQYGLSLGLSLAADILTDPSSVFPGVFLQKPISVADAFSPAYSTSPDELIDQTGEK